MLSNSLKTMGLQNIGDLLHKAGFVARDPAALHPFRP